MQQQSTRKIISLLAVFALALTFYTAVCQEAIAQALRGLAVSKNLAVGAAVLYDPLMNNTTYRQILAQEFNTVTPENAMKWSIVHYQPDKYDFTQADKIVDFALANNMKVRGHTLVWYGALPAWLTNGNYDRTQLMSILKSHIQTVMKHFKGRVSEWDVVNEAISEDGKTFRDNIWLRVIGSEYIEYAFRWAREADPSAKLYYNDYGTEGLTKKASTTYYMLQRLKSRGVPVDGVGLQMHLKLQNPLNPADVLSNMNRLGALGLETAITEMDVNIKEPATYTLARRYDMQADVYRNMLQTCITAASCNTFVTWGFTDAYTWIPDGYPLLLDASYKAKPAYAAVQQTLQQ